MEHYLFEKQCMERIQSKTTDKLCVLRAIVVGRALADSDINYNRIRDSRNSYQSD